MRILEITDTQDARRDISLFRTRIEDLEQSGVSKGELVPFQKQLNKIATVALEKPIGRRAFFKGAKNTAVWITQLGRLGKLLDAIPSPLQALNYGGARYEDITPHMALAEKLIDLINTNYDDIRSWMDGLFKSGQDKEKDYKRYITGNEEDRQIALEVADMIEQGIEYDEVKRFLLKLDVGNESDIDLMIGEISNDYVKSEGDFAEEETPN